MSYITDRIKIYKATGNGWDGLKAWLAKRSYPDPARYSQKPDYYSDDLVPYTDGTWDEVRDCRDIGLLTNDEYMQIVKMADTFRQPPPQKKSLEKYSDSEPRDDHGRWTTGGGSEPGSAPPPPPSPEIGRDPSKWGPLSPSVVGNSGQFAGTIVDATTITGKDKQALYNQIMKMEDKVDADYKAGAIDSHAAGVAQHALQFVRYSMNPGFVPGTSVKSVGFVAMDGNKISGGALLYPSASGELHAKGTAELAYLGSFQRGAGSALLHEAESYAQSHGAKTIGLVSSEYAKTFYQSHGYVPNSHAHPAGGNFDFLKTFAVHKEADPAVTPPTVPADHNVLDPVGVLACSQSVMDAHPEIKSAGVFRAKYSEDEPREPAGGPGGGEWTGGGGTSASSLPMKSEDFSGVVNAFPADLSMEKMRSYIGSRYSEEAAKATGLALATGLKDNEAWKQLVRESTTHGDPFIVDTRNADGVAKDLVLTWTSTSGDHDNTALAMQGAAAKEFNLSGVRDYPAADKAYNESSPGQRAGYQAFVREMYNQTQADLAAHGIKDVYVMRGSTTEYKGDPAVKDLSMNPMTSFAVDADAASHFTNNFGRPIGGTMTVTKIPASRILSTGRTGFGTHYEKEVVVLGGKTEGIRMLGSKAGWQGDARNALSGRKAHKATDTKVDIDSTLEDQDWIKQSWNLPPYKSPDFMRIIQGNLENFRTLPVYKNAVKDGVIVNDEWVGPRKALRGVVYLDTKYSEDEPRVPAGGPGGGEWGDGTGTSDDRAARAIRTYKPSNKAKQALASEGEQRVAAALGGDRTGDHKPLDVTVKNAAGRLQGVEVKTLVDNGNNKITMHPESLQRKLVWSAKNHAAVSTVVVDSKTWQFYYRSGVGSFRIGAMEKVSVTKLRSYIIGKK